MLREDMDYSDKQAIFVRDNARIVKTQPIGVYHEI